MSSEDVFTVTNAKHVTPLYGLRKLKGWLDKQLRPISGQRSSRLRARLLGCRGTREIEIAHDEPFFR